MDERRLRQMKALIKQAIAEAHHDHQHPRVTEIWFITYGGMEKSEVESLFAEASRDTIIEGAQLRLQETGSRYICWNCCGLRFESIDGVCPNCGEVALEVPEEIGFSLRDIKVEEAGQSSG